MDPDQLALLTMDDLRKEFYRRFKRVVIIVHGPIGEETDIQVACKEDDWPAGIGLCHLAIREFANSYADRDDCDEDEDS